MSIVVTGPEIGYATLVMGGNGNDRDVVELLEFARWESLKPILRGLEIDDPKPRLRIALRAWSSLNEGAIVDWLKRRDLHADELVDLMAQALLSAVRLTGIEPPVDSEGPARRSP